MELSQATSDHWLLEPSQPAHDEAWNWQIGAVSDKQEHKMPIFGGIYSTLCASPEVKKNS